jgi:hypothetical protein
MKKIQINNNLMINDCECKLVKKYIIESKVKDNKIGIGKHD